jgi:hypothetical protein
MPKIKFNLNNCKIIKELGHGMDGTTWLVKLNSTKYALKIEKIPESHAIEHFNTKHREWRDIKFSEEFGNEYPEQFIKLYTWDIVSDCKYINTSDFSHLPKEVQKIYQDKSDSKFCVRKLYSLVNTDLSKIIKTLNKKQIYSLVIQNAHIIWLLNSHGYSHNDLHRSNIGVIYTKKKYINIFNNKISIPTYGNIFVALDFGNVTNNLWILDKYEKKFKSKDTIKILTKLVKYKCKFNVGPDSYQHQTNKLIFAKNIDPNKLNLIKEATEWDYLNQFVADSNLDDKIILFQILYPEIFQRIFFGNEFEKIIKLDCLLDIKDIIYFIKNKSNLKKIIKYFVCRVYEIETN